MVTRIRAVLGVPTSGKWITRAGFNPTESLLSPIRTLTVGPGITPDLLTLPLDMGSARGLSAVADLPPVGNFAPP